MRGVYTMYLFCPVFAASDLLFQLESYEFYVMIS